MAEEDKKPEAAGIGIVQKREKAKGFLSKIFGKSSPINKAAKEIEGAGEGKESATQRRLREAGA